MTGHKCKSCGSEWADHMEHDHDYVPALRAYRAPKIEILLDWNAEADTSPRDLAEHTAERTKFRCPECTSAFRVTCQSCECPEYD